MIATAPPRRRRLHLCLLCLLAACEPVLHALGVPHPEGLSAHAANLLAAVGSDS